MKDKISLEIEHTITVTLEMDYDEADKLLEEYQQVICEEDEQDEMFKYIAERYLQGDIKFIEGIGVLKDTSIEVTIDDCSTDILSEDYKDYPE
ncbi:MAG: hypothetical protein GY870_18670 [archaeon]|nr:hypothetical protein [archaeon]